MLVGLLVLFLVWLEVALAEIAAARGISLVELEGISVPTFGLEASGGLELDFGARQFRASVAHDLIVRLSDASGKQLPRAGVKDDPVKAAAATAVFRELKKQLTNLLRIQMARLEAAMSSRRTWTSKQFQQVFLAHPFMRCVAHRLVWSINGECAFRVDEDFCPVGRSNALIELPKGPVSRWPIRWACLPGSWNNRCRSSSTTRSSPSSSRSVVESTGTCRICRGSGFRSVRSKDWWRTAGGVTSRTASSPD